LVVGGGVVFLGGWFGGVSDSRRGETFTSKKSHEVCCHEKDKLGKPLRRRRDRQLFRVVKVIFSWRSEKPRPKKRGTIKKSNDNPFGCPTARKHDNTPFHKATRDRQAIKKAEQGQDACHFSNRPRPRRAYITPSHKLKNKGNRRLHPPMISKLRMHSVRKW